MICQGNVKNSVLTTVVFTSVLLNCLVEVCVSDDDTHNNNPSFLRSGRFHPHSGSGSSSSKNRFLVTTYEPEEEDMCELPYNTDEFSLITKEDAEVAPKNIYKGLLVGGTLSDPYPSTSKVVGGKSYVNALQQPAGYNFNQGIETNVMIEDIIEYEKFEYLARNAKEGSYSQNYQVFVLDHGGSFSTYDFVPGGQGEDNGKTLVIFNTEETVTLTKTTDGRQFGPSVIAPFSIVDLHGNAGYIDGFVVAKQFGSFSSNGNQATQLQMHGDAYTGPIECNQETLPPTNVPTTSTPITSPPTIAPTITSGAKGDPHITTWTGERYDFHGICDLVLLYNPKFDKNLGMYIHIRSKKTRRWSYIAATVIKIGSDSLEVSGDRKKNLYWINKQQGPENVPAFFVDPVDSSFTLLMATLSGYAIKYQHINENNEQSRQFVVDLSSKKKASSRALKREMKNEKEEKIVIKTWHDMVRVDVIVNRNNGGGKIAATTASNVNFDSSGGLMGTFQDGMKVGRDKKSVFDNINDFGEEWQVLASEPKLFHDDDIGIPQAPVKCIIPSRNELRRHLAESNISRESADIACSRVITNENDYDLCMFDVIVTGDISAARAYQ